MATISKARVATEERRLRAAFLPVLLLAAGVPTAIACGTSASDDATSSASNLTSGDDAGQATTGDAAGPSDAGVVDFDSSTCAPHPFVPPDPDAAADTCIEFKRAECGLPPEYVSLTDGCYLSISQCSEICHRMMRPCHAWGDSCVDGGIVKGRPVVIECAICPGAAGRRPEGFEGVTRPSAGKPLAEFFVEMARLEAASIDAFDRLRDELEAHGAPPELVDEAERARKDEIAHTRVMSRLARRHGGKPKRVARVERRTRSLEAIARENMVEGCVRETFGALIAAWQASHSPDPEIARALGRVADDELRHAALSWAVAKWSDSVLSDDERAAIAHARDEAIANLFEEAERPLHPELVGVAGLPSCEAQKRMLDGMRDWLWAA